MKNILIIVLGVYSVLGFNSCIIQSPKYTKVEQVFTLHLGMSKEEVSKVLGIQPYDVKSIQDTSTVLIYKYRVTDRLVFLFNEKPTNGIKANGNYVNLLITYNKEGKVTDIRSCSECQETKVARMQLNMDKVITLLTVTLPLVLVFFGLK